MIPERSDKNWSEVMSSCVTPPGLPIYGNAKDHERFMAQRYEFLNKNGYYINPYFIMHRLFPGTFQKVIRSEVSLHQYIPGKICYNQTDSERSLNALKAVLRNLK